MALFFVHRFLFESFLLVFEKTNKIKVNYQIAPRRKGDAAISFADNSKSKKILQWKPQLNYTNMMRDAWLAAQR